MQPALRFEEVLERAFELVDRGAFVPDGVVDPEPVEASVAEFADEYTPGRAISVASPESAVLEVVAHERHDDDGQPGVVARTPVSDLQR
ncbi:MAG: hypothetical protein M3N47_13300 [Chloroflexota bacterium]|nr:hypothetical protein [Chloroflexota bacterium]